MRKYRSKKIFTENGIEYCEYSVDNARGTKVTDQNMTKDLDGKDIPANRKGFQEAENPIPER